MYQLKYKDYILHDMRLADEKLIIRDPSVKLAVSKAGEMSFTVDAEHPYLSNLRPHERPCGAAGRHFAHI